MPHTRDIGPRSPGKVAESRQRQREKQARKRAEAIAQRERQRKAQRDAGGAELVRQAKANSGKCSTAVMGSTATIPAPPARQKTPGKVRQAIRDSARGEECTVRLIGVCSFDPEKTVWSHYPQNDGGKGMGTKSMDLLGCYCCATCHDVVDGRAPRPPGLTRDAAMLAWFDGHMRSIVRLAQKGLL